MSISILYFLENYALNDLKTLLQIVWANTSVVAIVVICVNSDIVRMLDNMGSGINPV